MSKAKDAIYVILGASGDIGFEIAQRIAEKSEYVFLTFFRAESPKVYRELWHAVDVTSVTSIDIFAKKVESIGPLPLKVVYCSGIVDDHPIPMISHESWNRLINVNLTGAFNVVQRFFKTLAIASGGRLIFIGSLSSKKAGLGQSAYAASKAGLEALNRVCALELGRFGVTCNVVAPGAIESAMVRNTQPTVVRSVLNTTPLRKLGNVADVANLVEFLLSDLGNHITGQTIYLDGGSSII